MRIPRIRSDVKSQDLVPSDCHAMGIQQLHVSHCKTRPQTLKLPILERAVLYAVKSAPNLPLVEVAVFDAFRAAVSVKKIRPCDHHKHDACLRLVKETCGPLDERMAVSAASRDFVMSSDFTEPIDHCRFALFSSLIANGERAHQLLRAPLRTRLAIDSDQPD